MSSHQRLTVLLAVVLSATAAPAADVSREQAIEAMTEATRFFRGEIAASGRYLWQYRHEPPLMTWARRSLLSDGRLPRFYELHTNRPL